MRKVPITAFKSLVIMFVIGVQGVAGKSKTTFSCDQNATPNEPYSITCNIIGTIEKGIQWLRPDGTQVAACSDATECLDLVPGYTITTKTRAVNVLQIASMGNDDVGRWTCQDGSGGDTGCEIILQKTSSYSLTILSTQSTYHVGDILKVSVDVKEYYCTETPLFHLLLDSEKVDLDAFPRTPSTDLNGAQNKSINVTENMTGSIKLVFNCRVDTVLDEKMFTVPANATEPPISGTLGGLGPGAIAGIVVGCVFAVALGIVIVVVVVLKKKN